MPTASRLLLRSPSAAERLASATDWLARRGKSEEIVLLGPTLEAAAALARRAAVETGGSFGWLRTTIGRAAAALAGPALAARGLAPAGALPLEALCARVVDRLAAKGALGRFQPVAGYPGLPRALSRTLGELRLGGADGALGSLGPAFADILCVHEAYEAELASAALADRALVLRLAAEAARDPSNEHPLLGRPLLLLDVPCWTLIERDLYAALAGRSPDVLATVPEGDERSLTNLHAAVGAGPTAPGLRVDGTTETGSSLRRIQDHLFSDVEISPSGLGDDVAILSAPGESRECVEIARLAQREAARGVPFDRMAILLRAPAPYRAHVEEALRRASIPAHFAKGTVAPDPAGRAFVALLACASENLSARRFAEYLSLGQVPDATGEGAPPAPRPASERWVPPDEELLHATRGSASLDEPSPTLEPDGETDLAPPPPPALAGAAPRPVAAGTLRAPRRWERLLVESAVIGGIERWKRRLDGLAEEYALSRADLDADDPGVLRLDKNLADLDALRRFALPLLERLRALPSRASWGGWIDALSALATSALRDPERVLAVLAELAPMDSVGQVELSEVRLVLGRRLTDLVMPPGRAAGRIYVAPIDAARGLSFDVVFVPGLAEKIFPQKVVEDPILLDRERARIGLDTNDARVARERLALRLAAGAARSRLVLSYPRVDMDQSRPRVPSFYGLEILRAAEGALPGFGDLARRAEQGGAARIGWPAPASPELAIDEAEYDLALLESIIHLPPEDTVGKARYLLKANEHLARSLRSRARRWNIPSWKKEDGFVDPSDDAKAALAQHQLAARSFSPTALQHFAGCPYRFFLSAVHRLQPRQVPEAIEELDPLQKGSLVHEVLYELYTELRRDGELPVTLANLPDVHERLDRVIERVAAAYEWRLAPAIDRVYRDGIESAKADLREMLRATAADGASWTPVWFERSFGLTEHRGGRDEHSSDEPVLLDCGIRLRGSIDLVERSRAGSLRATDYKTGKVRAKQGSVITGGNMLQPVFYALAMEKMEPGQRVENGRLYYCTSAGGFEDIVIVLDDRARRSAATVAAVVGRALETGFLPAAPAKGACEYCDYRDVCGPYEELRAGKKSQDALAPLLQLRALP